MVNAEMSILTNISRCVDTMIDFLSQNTSDTPFVINSCDQYPPTFILYTSEQLTRPSQLENVLEMAKRPGCLEIWDYSAANVAILANHGVQARHMPLKISDDYATRLRSYRAAGQSYDVGFCGWVNERRRAILNACKEKGLSVNIITSWGEERDRALAQCKVLINIHYEDDYNIFESNRCEPWLAIGVPIVSEKSLDDDPRCINVSYEKLVSATLELCNNNIPV
jgi:hypothetical protein